MPPSGRPDGRDGQGTGTDTTTQPCRRDNWLLGGDFTGARNGAAGCDDDPLAAFLGGEGRMKKQKAERPDPDKLHISDKELNLHLKAGLEVHEYPKDEKRAHEFGNAGSSWRMMKLKRTFEAAKEQRRSPEEIGLQRYGSIEKWQEALAERDELDRRAGRKRRGDYGGGYVGKAGPSTGRQKYPRGASQESSSHFGDISDGQADRFCRTVKRVKAASPPPPSSHASVAVSESCLSKTKDELNRLSAKILRARMMGSSTLAELERQYVVMKKELEMGTSAPDGTNQQLENKAQKTVVMLPPIDSTGRLTSLVATKSERKPSATHDKLGRRLNYGNAGEGSSLEDLVRQERGARRENLAAAAVDRIARDAGFSDGLDYMDEHADKMAQVKERTEDQKRQLAINDYKKTSKVLDRCIYCSQSGDPPRAAVVSRGHHVLLALPPTAELTPGHCLIVPAQHIVTSVECDDDVWDEIRNFQKCLLRMFDEEDRGCIFMETVVNIDRYKHTAIECIPLPRVAAEDAPAYFKEGILGAGEEWSQHKKLIPTSKERGIRKSLTKHLPYFHVWLGIDKGYGTVIEDSSFPENFGAEIIGGIRDFPPSVWRKPRKYDFRENARRVQEFRKKWQKWDWTAALVG